ncbi:S-methyl-5-thioribose-1-phosphate isomerase [Candidatus Latescibacterota bacterium]
MLVQTVRWVDDALVILDQRLLPLREEYISLRTTDEVCKAIRMLAVRGAPAIGVAAAYGVVIAAREKPDPASVREAIRRLGETRPTAVNLFYALSVMDDVLEDAFSSGDPVGRLLKQAHEVFEEDMRICRTLSHFGAELLADGDTILTHCNAGGLATSGWGTALGIVYAAVESGKRISVYADETRPLLQGGRLTAWELEKNDIPVTVICDGMAAEVLRQGRINHVIVGADRIAANGDAANKIGTYGLSIAAREHGVPFMVAAPLTSFDFRLSSGSDIPIEERDAREIYHLWDPLRVQTGVSFYNPAFDVTPAANITAIISEYGVARHPLDDALAAWRDVWDALVERHSRETGPGQ